MMMMIKVIIEVLETVLGVLLSHLVSIKKFKIIHYSSVKIGILGLKRLSKFSQNYEMEKKEHGESAK